VPAPDVYGDGLINPLPENNPAERIPYTGILYATDRIPATAEDPETYYVNDRCQVVRLGAAEVTLGEQDIAWESARDISMITTRTDEYPVKIASIDEWGILGRYRFDVSGWASAGCDPAVCGYYSRVRIKRRP
jgi:hypothetical protein